MSNGSDWLPPGASKPPQEQPKKKKVEFLGYGIGQWVAAGIIAVVALFWFAGRDGSSLQTMESRSEPASSATTDKTMPLETAEAIEEPPSTAPSIICDTFEIIANLDERTLMLSLDTDLPDDAVISVTVGRSYWERGSDTEYAREYFEENATVGDWRLPRAIPLSSDAWRKNLSDFQKEMERATLGFEVAKISDEVSIRIVLPVNGQTNTDFGARNANLSGSAVETESYGNLVSDEVFITTPL